MFTSKFEYLNKKWIWLPLLIILVGINILAAEFHTRIDLTNEKRFTISSPVKKIIKNLPGIVYIDVFLKGDLPSAFKGIASYTDDLLHEFRELGGTKIQFRFINPDDLIDGTEKTYSDTLKGLNINPINLKVQLKTGEQSQYIYPAA